MRMLMMLGSTTVLSLTMCGAASGADAMPSGRAAEVLTTGELDELAGQPVDIAPWAYAWRADTAVQEEPEACFIPRRLDRIDTVYRTARSALPESELKSIHYDMPDLLETLPPAPEGELTAGLLWTGKVADYRVELQWPAGADAVPSAEDVEVRAYPTSYGWFGWTVDRILAGPEISSDGRTWTYASDPTEQMDFSYNVRVQAATEMVAVFVKRGDVSAVVPTMRVHGPSIGTWKRMDVEIEWGFQDGTDRSAFDGWIEPSIAMVGPVAALNEGAGVTVEDGYRWQSSGSSASSDSARRGIVVPLLYAPESCPGLDSRITLWTSRGGVTFRVKDLENGPILIPEQGVFVAKAGSGQSARQFAEALAGKGLKGVRQMTREHREAASFEELMQEVRLWTCPEGTALAPFPEVADPAMQVDLSDAGWTAAWRAASFQLTGEHMWGGLAFEVGRVAHEMDMIGLHPQADKVYEHFLSGPGAKPDGDYADGDGALEWATSMRHDMGYSHDGTHASTGRLLFAMAERYFLTGDREWFDQRRARLQAAADWIVRQRNVYMDYVPNRDDLHVAGLMPPCMLGDYAIPSCDWHWYYVDNALALQGLQRFADALRDFDADAAQKYSEEAEAFRNDLCRAIDREAVLAPVRPGRDGMFHTYLPRMAYARGLTGPELGAPQYPGCDRWIGALPLAEPYAAMDAGDVRMADTLDMMEEMGTSAKAVAEQEEARKAKGLPADDAWFWNCHVGLPKASHNANIYLLEDDIPNFLRFWSNAYASMVGADGKLWEHWHLGGFDPCESPDNGTAGWFMENFRDLLVMEEGQSLWVARATPRAWLDQGKRIAVSNAPTYFGMLAYEIVSDVDNGTIAATVEMPVRTSPEAVLLRLRHPAQAPMKRVTVNGREWTDFDPANEVVRLHDVSGNVRVVAAY